MKIVGLCSPFNGIGKTTLAEAIKEEYPRVVIRSFATPFKELSAFAMAFAEIEDIAEKDQPFAFNGQVVTQRDITIEIARAVNRVLPGYPEYVMDIQCKKLATTNRELLVIDDVRRKSEVAFIRDRGGIVIGVHRERDAGMRLCEIYELDAGYVDHAVYIGDTNRAVSDILEILGE